jgi:hypothetical protein
VNGRILLVVATAALVWARPLAAQTGDRAFQAGVHVAISDSDQFNTRDAGLGGRLSWHPQPLLGIEGEITYFSDVLSDAPTLSDGRLEGLFGATIGPRLGAVRPFAKLRPGFLRYLAADGPVACIAIFPPPLSCILAEGETLFALDVGGGIEWYPIAGAFIRADVGDRIVRFPGPAFDAQGEAHDGSFTGHDLRVAIGAGVRF